ncbi:helix-turn-helix domain-containing protein [Actinomyces provencensis]|uniref:helix-turn-helix domain-containing protein n=1 Tax=Actinomyces provencensis TaxID=1720198 RepID=UPI00096AA817|nr:helix-turn-helix domain-containing protein [Actinomyces provencensis]
MTRWRGRRWAVITSVAGTVFIAAGAFWLSFTALADLARRAGIGEGQAWAWPLIVDGVIVVSTVAVVALAGERAAWYPWTLLIGGAAVSVTANALHAIVAADADVPVGLAAAVAAVPPVVLLASTHLTVVLIRTTTQPAAEVAGARESVALEVMPAVPPAVASPTPELTRIAPADVVDRRVRAAELRESGWSNKKIARSLDVHPSTVGRWFADAHQPGEPEQPDSAPMPMLEGATP